MALTDKPCESRLVKVNCSASYQFWPTGEPVQLMALYCGNVLRDCLMDWALAPLTGKLEYGIPMPLAARTERCEALRLEYKARSMLESSVAAEIELPGAGW